MLILLAFNSVAFEGMWMPEQVPDLAERLVELGLEIPPENLANPMEEPLAAIASLGGYCSASFVSSNGLLVTNHHCIGGPLQYVSTAQENYAHRGFVAKSSTDEMSAGPGTRLWVVEQIVDITDEVRPALDAVRNDRDRQQRLDTLIKEQVSGCEAGRPNRRCSVSSFSGGQAYRRFESLEIQDIRLVYAPPDAVGNYGDDIDNWMWPRHGGDFAFLRAYVAQDGSSAPYAAENIPLQSSHWLKTQIAGVQPGDLVAVAGFPGWTHRHVLADELEYRLNEGIPRDVRHLDHFIQIYGEWIANDPTAAAKMSGAVARLSNMRKKQRGMQEALGDGALVAQRRAEEAELLAWIAADRKRKKAWGGAHADLVALFEGERAEAIREDALSSLQYAALLSTAHTAYRWSMERAKPDDERDRGFQSRDEDQIRARLTRLEHTLYLASNLEIFRFYATINEELEDGLPALKAWVAAHGGVDAAVEALRNSPLTASTDGRLALMELTPSDFEASTDPWVQLAVVLERRWRPRREVERTRNGKLLSALPRYLEAKHAHAPAQVYPDANRALRLSFGQVEGFAPRDGVLYLPQTTVRGSSSRCCRQSLPRDGAGERRHGEASATQRSSVLAPSPTPAIGRAGPRSRSRPHPPGHQARQHSHGCGWRSQTRSPHRRLWDRPRPGVWRTRDGHGHPAKHAPRAAHRRDPHPRSLDRPLRLRVRRLAAAGGPSPVLGQ